METIKIERNRTNEKSEIMLEGDFKQIDYSEYWNSHGDLVPWGKKKTFKDCKLKIIKKTWKEFNSDWETWTAYINDEPLDGDIFSYKGKPDRLVIKGCVGWG